MKIIETGIIDDVDAIFGMHCTPLLDVGQMGIIDGPAMAAVDAFRITFHGKGVHAAHPDKGIDPIVTASAFVGAVQTVVSRNMDPFPLLWSALPILKAVTTGMSFLMKLLLKVRRGV